MEVIFSPSAFRHGYVEQDFYELLATKYLKIRSQRGLDDVYELLGRNLSGAYLHAIYRALPDRTLRAFHRSTMTEAQKKRYRRYRKMKKPRGKISRLAKNASDDDIIRGQKPTMYSIAWKPVYPK